MPLHLLCICACCAFQFIYVLLISAMDIVHCAENDLLYMQQMENIHCAAVADAAEETLSTLFFAKGQQKNKAENVFLQQQLLQQRNGYFPLAAFDFFFDQRNGKIHCADHCNANINCFNQRNGYYHCADCNLFDSAGN